MPDNIIRLDTIEKYNRILGAETLHPLVSMTDLSKLKNIRHCRKEFGFYCIFYKELACGTIQYGRSKYDYQEGTLLFVSPGQIAGVDDGGETPNPRGLVLMFHPDSLYGTPGTQDQGLQLLFIRLQRSPAYVGARKADYTELLPGDRRRT